MGKSGGHKKVKTQTGTQQKATKQSNKEFRKTAKYREQGAKTFSNIASGEDALSKQLQGQFGPGGQAFNQPLHNEQFQRDFDPIRQEQMRQFQEEALPAVQNTFGRGVGRGDSALNQALQTAARQLQSQLNSQYTQFGLGERARQQELQYNTLQGGIANRQQAAGQLQNVGLSQGQMGQREQFAFQPKSTPFIQDLLLAGTEAAGRAGAAAATGGVSEVAGAAGKLANAGPTIQSGRLR